MNPTNMLQLLAKDLSKEFPRSPRETMAGYVIAARCLDKCRSALAGKAGEYHSGCPLDDIFLDFIGIPYEAFKTFVATGATDEEVEAWLIENGKKQSKMEIIKWNNEWRGKRLGETPEGIQEYMEEYIPKFLPKNRPVYHFFDIYDIEEERI
jgi:hypothetical protein